jgi:hypothetical protein
MTFNYVFARSYGNAEGYVNSTLGQEDAGATQDFDHPLFVDGSTGPLPNDRPHQFKIFGSYQVTEEIIAGFNFSALEGIPLSCNGVIPLDLLPEPPNGSNSTVYDRNNFARYAASSFYCSNEDGEPELTARGSEGRMPWLINLDASVTYRPNWLEGLQFSARVFNVTNRQKGTTFDQSRDIARGNPLADPNYLTPQTFQAPRRVELSVRYKF